MSPDTLLLVFAPELDGAEPLANVLGMPWLKVFSAALTTLSSNEDDELVNIEVKDQHLIIDEGARGVAKLLTVAPRTLGTFIDEETAIALEAKALRHEEIPLTHQLVNDVRETFKLFKAERIELTVGPKGGHLQVGDDDGNTAVFASAAFKAEENYSLLFGYHLTKVFDVISNFESARLILCGPKNPIWVEDDGYSYLIFARAKGADDK